MTKSQVKAFRKLAKASGWSRRGNPDARIAQLRDLLKKAGFRASRKPRTGGIVPDGSRAWGTEIYSHPLGLYAEIYQSIGAVKADNFNSFDLRTSR